MDSQVLSRGAATPTQSSLLTWGHNLYNFTIEENRWSSLDYKGSQAQSYNQDGEVKLFGIVQ